MLTDDARLTAVGHSYGGAIVGKADQYGAPMDNVVHLSSAGTGHQEGEPRSIKVSSPDYMPQYPIWIRPKHHNPYPDTDVLGDSKADTNRYADTPGGDAIRFSQGFDNFGIGHGSDPDHECGMRVLPEGEYLPAIRTTPESEILWRRKNGGTSAWKCTRSPTSLTRPTPAGLERLHSATQFPHMTHNRRATSPSIHYSEHTAKIPTRQCDNAVRGSSTTCTFFSLIKTH